MSTPSSSTSFQTADPNPFVRLTTATTTFLTTYLSTHNLPPFQIQIPHRHTLSCAASSFMDLIDTLPINLMELHANIVDALLSLPPNDPTHPFLMAILNELHERSNRYFSENIVPVWDELMQEETEREERAKQEVEQLGRMFEVEMDLGLESKDFAEDNIAYNHAHSIAENDNGEGSSRQQDLSGSDFAAPSFELERLEHPVFVSWEDREEWNGRFEMGEAMFDVGFGNGSAVMSGGWNRDVELCVGVGQEDDGFEEMVRGLQGVGIGGEDIDENAASVEK